MMENKFPFKLDMEFMNFDDQTRSQSKMSIICRQHPNFSRKSVHADNDLRRIFG